MARSLQILTPSPDGAAIAWKLRTLAADQHRFVGMKSERLKRAIAADKAFIAAHANTLRRPARVAIDEKEP
jgi:hypothetical protein